MGMRGVIGFYRELQYDEDLRQQAVALQAAPDDERIEGLCRLAADRGFDVSPEDLRQPPDGESGRALSEADLEAVAGAGCEYLDGIVGW